LKYLASQQVHYKNGPKKQEKDDKQCKYKLWLAFHLDTGKDALALYKMGNETNAQC
jgi:hypothetical protein